MDPTEELAAFLRTRRERLHPDDFGLPRRRSGRTPGLRREEVAEPAGISIDYVVRLLVAADKAGNWRRWYDQAISLAEKRYAQHLADTWKGSR